MLSTMAGAGEQRPYDGLTLWKGVALVPATNN